MFFPALVLSLAVLASVCLISLLCGPSPRPHTAPAQRGRGRQLEGPLPGAPPRLLRRALGGMDTAAAATAPPPGTAWEGCGTAQARSLERRHCPPSPLLPPSALPGTLPGAPALTCLGRGLGSRRAAGGSGAAAARRRRRGQGAAAAAAAAAAPAGVSQAGAARLY